MLALRIFGSLSLTVAAGEIAAILAARSFAGENTAVFHGIILLAVTLPLLWFWCARPLVGLLRQKSAATEEFRRAVAEMNARIEERDNEVAIAQRILEDAHSQLDGALNNMHQGLCMYDAEARLVLCNTRYRDLYDLPAELVKPGMTCREILDIQTERDNFHQDPDRYIQNIRSKVARGESIEAFANLKNRTIRVITTPRPGGGWIATHEDVTAQRRAEADLANTRNFLNQVIEHVPATILVKDARDLRYVLLNQAGVEFFGYPREQILGKTVYDFFPKATADALTERDLELLASGEQYYYEDTPLHNPKNPISQIATKRLVIKGPNGEPAYILGVIEDISERKRAEAEIIRLAHHDTLTGLPNRAAFNRKLAESLEAAATEGSSLAVICIDLDRFKEINDVYGHAAGDALLEEISRRLQAAAGDAFLARLGGDEFVIISRSGTNVAKVAAAAVECSNRLLATVKTDIDVAGHALSVGISVGVAIYPTNGADATGLMSNADAALYRAKAEGRNTARFFAPEMDTSVRQRRVMQQELRLAIPNGELSLHYQPLTLANGEVSGFEALARWIHPVHGLVPPGTFIPLAEESSLIFSMGEWILREACREAATWPRPLQLAVNLSPVQFRHGDLAATVHTILLETGFAPSRLELEITESVLIGDMSRAVAVLRRLKALGVRISMDDFGSGYSSLSYLQSFPFDKIKIDRAFVANVERNPQSAAIVRAVIGLGRGLQVPVVAEGVETQEQFAFLRNEACDQMQGYLLGRPGPIEHYAETIGRAAQKAAAVG